MLIRENTYSNFLDKHINKDRHPILLPVFHMQMLHKDQSSLL